MMDMDAAALRFFVVLLMLAGASWSDLRTRRVRNQYWLPFLAIAAALWLSDPGDRPLLRAAGAAAMTLLAYLLWRVGTFGGADAKGLMVFSWVWPGLPDLLASRTVPVLDTLVNATLIALALPLLFLLINTIRGDFAFPALLLGTRMPLARAQTRHVWPMQRLRHDVGAVDTPVAPPVAPPLPAPMAPPAMDPGYPPLPQQPVSAPPPTSEPPLRWRFWHRPGEDLGQTYTGLRQAGASHVWVTPKIPFMVPLAAASAATWAWGNVVLRLMLRA